MSRHTATIQWTHTDTDDTEDRHGTAHVWRFDGGAVVPASASPSVVPVPFSQPAHVDPEEALIAAASSCHMLWFLDFAHQAGFAVADYVDEAEGTMGRLGPGRFAITHIRLRPRVQYLGPAPDQATETALHDKAHEACFIANSLTATIETVIGDLSP